MAIALTTLLLCAVALFARGTPAGAAAYPPPPPGPTAVTCPAGASSVDSSLCGKESINTHKTPPQDSLASTGFDVATALGVMVVLFGVGGVCLYVGLRRRA